MLRPSFSTSVPVPTVSKEVKVFVSIDSGFISAAKGFIRLVRKEK